MNRHGKSRDGIVTISAKVEAWVRDELDRIKDKKNLENRSQVIKEAMKLFISHN